MMREIPARMIKPDQNVNQLMASVLNMPAMYETPSQNTMSPVLFDFADNDERKTNLRINTTAWEAPNARQNLSTALYIRGWLDVGAGMIQPGVPGTSTSVKSSMNALIATTTLGVLRNMAPSIIRKSPRETSPGTSKPPPLGATGLLFSKGLAEKSIKETTPEFDAVLCFIIIVKRDPAPIFELCIFIIVL